MLPKDIENKLEPDKVEEPSSLIKGNDESKNQSVVSYEEVLKAAGELGLYQCFLFLATFPFYTFCVFAYYSQIFITEVSPNHWCWIPELQHLSEEERRLLAIPLDENSRFGYSQCYAYDANWTYVLETGLTQNYTWNTIPCQNGWEFNKTEIPYPTITSEMGWVCDKDSYPATAQSLFFVGSIIGGISIGWISDRFGRLPAAIICNVIGCIGGVLSTFARNFIEFVLCRIVMGVSYDNCLMMAYLIVLEYVAPKYRTLFANLSFAIFYSAMVTSLPWIALACGHWKVIALVTSLPLGLAVFTPLILPESPRWLLSVGRVDDAIDKLKRIARINKKDIPPKLISEFKATANIHKDETGSYREIFKRPLLRRSFILIILVYMSCVIVFDALIRSVSLIDFDFFVAFSLLSFTEFPSLIVVAFIMDWLGRRWLTIIVMLISSVFSVLSVYVNTGLQSMICAIIARFAVNMSYNAAMQWSAELLPTPVRGAGVSLIHIFGFVAVFVSPYIVYLNTVYEELPMLIVGATALFGAVVAAFLPETSRLDMPQTFEDAEVMFNNQKLWKLPKKQKKTELYPEVNASFEL
ncbi:hypothetical protein K1T71_005785 [Dendrolimus kikuchii]|uniref:Uncharacterized protein n=1 Tax=Dendrolimus kikuchii TaxID=765133 RepID=A0ACC1D563_9NEOP|nr:hypothetical protein K1T71_005785 [Dendrolimus kikuchii]